METFLSSTIKSRHIAHTPRARWSRGAHVSEISEAHFHIGAVFINKPQIWVLNNYILAWNTRIQCRQALAVAVQHVWCRHGVTHLSRINKATSASDHRPSAPWVLSSAGKLIRSDIYTCPTLYLIVLHFFIRHLYLSVTRLGCSLNALSSISWVDTPLTADWLQVYFCTQPRLSFLKRFWKIAYCL